MIRNSVQEAMLQLGAQKERLLLNQLEELVKRNLLVIREESPVITQDPDGKFVLRQNVKFYLREQEYIEGLERENAELKKKLDTVMDFAQHILGKAMEDV